MFRVAGIHDYFLHRETGRVIITAREFSARRLQLPGEGVEHRVPPAGEFTAELDLKRMAGVVVDKQSHGTGESGGGAM